MKPHPQSAIKSRASKMWWLFSTKILHFVIESRGAVGFIKKKSACTIFFSETQPYLSKVSASRVKNRASRVKNEACFNFSEAQPVLSKSKTNLFDFADLMDLAARKKNSRTCCPAVVIWCRIDYFTITFVALLPVRTM